MRALTLAFALVVAPTAFGQIQPAELPIQDAFQLLRNKTTNYFLLSGTDTLGKTTTNIADELFWDSSGAMLPKLDLCKLEMRSWVNGKLLGRTVGDGKVLWDYDFRRDTYCASVYGQYGATPVQLPVYRESLLQSFNATTKNPATYLARLIREVYSGAGADYRTWMPGAKIIQIVDPSPPVPDPVIPTRLYTPTPTRMFILYTFPTTRKRSLCFDFAQDTSGRWQLSTIYYGDVTGAGMSGRVVDWTMQVSAVPGSPATYVFIPPRTSKAIVAPHPSIIQ